MAAYQPYALNPHKSSLYGILVNEMPGSEHVGYNKIDDDYEKVSYLTNDYGKLAKSAKLRHWRLTRY